MHINWDVFNAITLAFWVYVLIPFYVWLVIDWLARKHRERRDRKIAAQIRDQLAQP